MRCGAPGRTRTADAGLRTASLCPLSYGGAAAIVPGPYGWEPGPAPASRAKPSRLPAAACFCPPDRRSHSTYNPARWPTLPSPTSSCTAAPAAACATRRATCSTALLEERATPACRRPTLVERDIETDPPRTAPTSPRSRSSSSATAGSSSRPAPRSSAACSADVLDAADRPHDAGTDLTILVALARGPDQLPLAVRAAARAGVPRPADGDRRRRVGRRRRAVALARRAPRARVRRRVRGRLHAARHHGHVRRRAAGRLPAGPARRSAASSSSSSA